MQQIPEIILSSKAHSYLHSKQVSNLVLELKQLYSSCVPYSPPPQITLSSPDNPLPFIRLHQDGICIYLDRALCGINRLTIDKHGFSIFSWLSVVDWRPILL